MAFLENLDLDVADKKSERVHYWYLFEQFKSLEQNQVEAAQKLRERTFQDKMLYSELNERRARRKLFTKNNHSLKNMDTRSFTISTDNFYESFSQIHDCESLPDPTIPFNFEPDSMLPDEFSSKDSMDSKINLDECDEGKGLFKNIVEQELFMNEELEMNKHLADDNQDFYVDEYEDEMWDEDSVESYDKVTIKSRADGTVFEAWSKLVSFACQAIQLNHGNCFYDCSSHLLTAVLVCDILMRGVGSVCHVLQPFVSPIKFNEAYVTKKRKQFRKANKICKAPRNKRGCSLTKGKESKYVAKEIQTESRNFEQAEVFNKMSLNLKRSSELWDSFMNDFNAPKFTSSCKSFVDIFDEDVCSNCIYGKVTNPMMEFIEYMDRQLETCEQLSKRI